MIEHPEARELEAFAYDAAEPARSGFLRDHVDVCQHCRHTVDLEREERETLIRALKPETAETFSFPSTALDVGAPKAARDGSARMLAAAAAAIVLFSALWLALPGGGTPLPVKQKSADPEWRFPVELGRVPLATMGLRGFFTTPGGVVGMWFNQTIYYSPAGASGLKRVDGIMIDPVSNLLVEGESARFLMVQDGKVELNTVNFADSATVSVIDVGRPGATRPLVLELAGRGDFRIALAELKTAEGPGMLLVSRSLDSGKTWGAWKEVARGTQNRGQRGLLATSLGTDIYYVTFSGGLACVRSTDRGETWTAALDIPCAPYAIADYLRVVATDRGIHLVFSGTGAGRGYDLVHTFSEDGGRSWSAPQVIAPLPRQWGIHPAVRDQYQLRMAGGALFCSTGSMAGLPDEAQLYVSRDEGKTWRREEEAFGGLRSRPMAALSCDGRRGTLLALDVALPEGGVDHLLLREYMPVAGIASPDPPPTWWKAGGK